MLFDSCTVADYILQTDILLELSNLNCHILLHWATFMYVAFYIVFYVL